MENPRNGNGPLYRHIRMALLLGFLSHFLSLASGSLAAPLEGREVIIGAPPLAPPTPNGQTLPASPPPQPPFSVSEPPPSGIDTPPPPPPFQVKPVPPAPSPALVPSSDYPSSSPPPVLSPGDSWNESEKAGVVIASVAALLQVAVVAFLLYKRHQMLTTVEYSDIDDLENEYPNHRHTDSA